MMSVLDLSDSPDTISSDSEDGVATTIEATDVTTNGSSQNSVSDSSAPVYVQSRMNVPHVVTSTAGSNSAKAGSIIAVNKDTSETKVTTSIPALKTYGAASIRPTIVAPTPNGMVAARKVLPSGANLAIVTGVWQGDKRKVVLAPVKRVNQEMQGARVILPGTTSQVQVSSGQGNSGAKQLNKGYIVSPSANRGNISILPRSSLFIEGGSGASTKIVNANFIKPRDGRIINASSTIRPMSVVNSSGNGTVSTPNLTPTYNILTMTKPQRPPVPGKVATSVGTMPAEKRIVIGHPSGQLKFIATEVSKNSDSKEVPSPEKLPSTTIAEDSDFSPANAGNDLTLSNSTRANDSNQQNLVPTPIKIVASCVPSPGQNPRESPATNHDIKKRDETSTIGNDADGNNPPEKPSTLRKAKILSFPTAKSKSINGLLIETPKSKPNQAASDRVRKRKDNHKTAAIGEPPQKIVVNSLENIKPMPGAECVNPFKAIRWDSKGVGILPGSSIKFKFNEYGMIEVSEDLLSSKIDFAKDTNGDVKVKKRDPSEIYCCSLCSCYGLLAEFFNENFCSIVCWESVNAQQDAIVQKMEEFPTPVLPVGTPAEAEPRKRKKQLIQDVDFEDDTNEPAEKVKKTSYVDVDEESNGSSQKSSESTAKPRGRPKGSTKSDKSEGPSKPIIKVKSMDSLTGSPVSGRQLRMRDSLSYQAKSKASPFIVGQDLEGSVSDDDEKIKGDQIDPFPWTDYLHLTESKAAWIKLFTSLFPSTPNPFKIGFKLEAIDPERQSLFCAATVADAQGHRVKIHFDGYPKKFDFWVNTDSPNIFPCGFCERHQIALQPPASFKKSLFNWHTYNQVRKSRPAPLSWFHNNRLSTTSTNMFRIGMKLEAVDKKNTQLICVSTVAGVIDDRILVHFDSWSDVYDFWVDTSSPYIHPVGWCAERGRELTPPNGYNPRKFSWDEYLKLTKSEAAPAAAFTLRPPKEFKKFSKLEAIDKRAPHILRVATIKEVLPYQIRIAFDGFPDHFGYWTDDDSPDIHPVNWGLKTGHPVAGPPEVRQIQYSNCPTPGCIGDGNFYGTAEFHANVSDCPYSNEHLNAESPLLNRLSSRIAQRKTPGTQENESNSDDDEDPERIWKFMDAARERTTSTSRVSASGDVFNYPCVTPPHQTFRLNKQSDVQNEGVETKETTSHKTYSKKSLQRRTSERNIKGVTTPNSDKTITPMQSPNKNTLTSDDKSKEIKKPSQPEGNIVERIRSKVTSEDPMKRDVALWNKQKCLEKLGELGPKYLDKFCDMSLNGGKLLMMNETDLQFQGLFSMADSIVVSNLISELRRHASLGVALWKKVDRV